MQFLEFKFTCLEGFREILIAELAEIGFDSFLETAEGFDAYITEMAFDRDAYQKVINQYASDAQVHVSEGKLPKINWNEEWEKHYDPILIEGEIYVRASFHSPQPNVKHEIVINPKMSFGTGHHATTFLMLSLLLDVVHHGKRVLDIGSGTGILAIMAHKLGAAQIEAFDIDDWCVENGNENFDLNGIHDLKMGLGSVREINPQGTFDVVLANINKNVLLDEMEAYATLVKQGGKILLSGFYEQDVNDIQSSAEKVGFKKLTLKTKDRWAALVLLKSN
jgi:ribosomal protein L11 methyltransferase